MALSHAPVGIVADAPEAFGAVGGPQKSSSRGMQERNSAVAGKEMNSASHERYDYGLRQCGS